MAKGVPKENSRSWGQIMSDMRELTDVELDSVGGGHHHHHHHHHGSLTSGGPSLGKDIIFSHDIFNITIVFEPVVQVGNTVVGGNLIGVNSGFSSVLSG